MDKAKEINRGYLDYLRNQSRHEVAAEGGPKEAPADSVLHKERQSLSWRFVAAVSGGMADGLKRPLRPIWVGLLDSVSFIRRRALPGALSFCRRVVAAVLMLTRQVVTSALLIFTSILLGAWLKMYLWLKRTPTAPLNSRAVERVSEFVGQYPFHIYPIVAKSFEFAFLEEELSGLLEKGARFLEIAIGEGTFSAKIFPPDAKVVGLDLSPYSLSKACQLPHVKAAVICDCLVPPIRGGHFDVVIANNFLHHVTMKGQALANWSKVAPKLIFNESTPYWGSGWAAPFILKKLGFRSAAQRKVNEINNLSLQHLEPKEVVDNLVRKEYEVMQESSYISERTFFLGAIYSFIMSCYGPPTPAHLKDFFLSRKLRWLSIGLTTAIAKMLIRYDQFQDRSTDAYVSYVCESRHPAVPQTEHYLVCPRCGGELTATTRCQGCGKQYSSIDQMLFLLPEEIEYVEMEYDPQLARSRPREHL